MHINSKTLIPVLFLLFPVNHCFSQDAEYYYLSGKSKVILMNYSGAVDDFTRSIKLSPTIAEYYLSRGKAYYNLESYNEASAGTCVVSS